MSNTEESDKKGKMTTKEELESQACVEKRERLFRKLQITYDMIKDLPNKENIFLSRAEKADEELKYFNDIQDKLARLNFMIPTGSQVNVSAVSDSYEELYYEVIARATSIVSDRKKNESDLNISAVQQVKLIRPKLPPIDIPKFKGDLEKFPAFKSLYDTLVHNTELQPIQKFSFLKSYLEFPALSVIDSFDFNDENYQAAYDKLVERYTDKRLVGTHYLNKLLQFKPLPNCSPNSLRQFIDVFCVQYESLKALKIPNLADFVMFNLAMKVLDPDTKRLFEDKHCKKDFPSFDDLSVFVKEQHKVASIVQAPNVSKSSATPSHSHVNHNIKSGKQGQSTKSFLSNYQEPTANVNDNKHVVQTPMAKSKCSLCKAEHRLSQCNTFIDMTPVKRLETVKSLKLCYACLGAHARSHCTSKYVCRSCKNKNHHTLLHRDQPQTQVQSSESHDSLPTCDKKVSNENTSTNALSCHVQSQLSKHHTNKGLLGTVKCCIKSSNGEWVKCRMIVDPASESSFISESLVQTLHLPRKKYSVDVIGVGSSTFSNNRGCVSCKIAPFQSKVPTLSVEAIVLQTISSNMPKVPLDPSIHERFSNLHLADPEFDKPGAIDLLLGVQHFSEILSENCLHIKGEPAALDTIFGFLIFGKIPCTENVTSSITMFTQTPTLDDMLRRFWSSEEPIDVISENKDDDDCEKFFIKTTTRDGYGRYQVSLPFRGGIQPTNLGSTRSVAQKRLLSLERRLSQHPTFKDQYNANLQDYVVQDHMRPASVPSDYLLTHHAVIKESTTTQVRVVFNASEKSDTSCSLNEFLLAGPKMQSDISQIILSFRMNPVALIADLKQMYRCIRLNPTDTKFTHLLWRQDCSLPITEWELTTLPFGLTSSPYLAQRTIKQLVSDEGSSFPAASKALLEDTYIDDVVSSVSSEKEAIELYSQLTDLLGKGGFSLHKFSSNSSKVLSHIPADHCETPISFESSNCIKLLGFLWDPLSDEFRYKLSMEQPVMTKRGVLSQVARIYDINGYIAPVTFWIKYFIQRLWLSGKDWDEVLPDSLSKPCMEFFSQLHEVQDIRIPRFISCSRPAAITLIGFCDASEKGYAACIYLRVQSQEGNVQVHLLKAKSKVAPLKTVTIPRLELNGSLLLSKLIDSVKNFLSTLPPYDLYCFTDSTTVLAWLRTPPHQLKTYIANRVVQILEVLPPSKWRHVSGKLNPADVASRGLFPSQLINNDLWWNGPEFLCKSPSEWPINDITVISPVPEIKSESVALITTQGDIASKKDCTIDHILQTYSSLPKVQRVLSYILRFITNVRLKVEERKVGELTHYEMSQALEVIIRKTQQNHYANEIKCIKNNLPLKGVIQHLTPFISERGLLMVGGRLALAPIPSLNKHPYLIPRKSKLAELICTHYHHITLHGGPLLMQSLIQRKFWIPGIRYILRSVVFKCLKCYRFKAKPLEPFMSSVPSSRFKMVRAFVNTGVDLAGPFLLKESKRRNAKVHKCWVVVFICLSTRAVYIDLVSDLTTAAFLSTFDRFIARRGIPAELYSDLGTNFVGASRELKNISHTLMQSSDELKRFCEEREIIWHFNPPSAPNFGGSWEAAVKSMKHHLKRVTAERPLTYEELSTLLARIEAILNSRPLCPVSSNPSDGFDYLTPGHFLVGAPLLFSRPEHDQLNQPIDYNSRWKLISRSVQDFWRRWSLEYIHTLMQRPKWDKRSPDLSVGKMVLLAEKNLPPTSWSLGRVLEVFPGNDNIVRVVKIKTVNGVFTRPANKLCVLPFQDDIDI